MGNCFGSRFNLSQSIKSSTTGMFLLHVYISIFFFLGFCYFHVFLRFLPFFFGGLFLRLFRCFIKGLSCEGIFLFW